MKDLILKLIGIDITVINNNVKINMDKIQRKNPKLAKSITQKLVESFKMDGYSVYLNEQQL